MISYDRMTDLKYLNTNGSLMKVESMPLGAFCNTFDLLSDTWYGKTFFGLFESGRFTQVLL